MSKFCDYRACISLGWRISTDTGCAGWRRVERTVDVKNTHTSYATTPPQVIRKTPISRELRLSRQNRLHRCVPFVDAVTTWVYLRQESFLTYTYLSSFSPKWQIYANLDFWPKSEKKLAKLFFEFSLPLRWQVYGKRYLLRILFDILFAILAQ